MSAKIGGLDTNMCTCGWVGGWTWMGRCVCVCVYACSAFVVLVSCVVHLCMCFSIGQGNNQEERKMKTTRQLRIYKIISVPVNGFEPTLSCLGINCDKP